MGVWKRYQTGLIIFLICIVSFFLIYKIINQDSLNNRRITDNSGINLAKVQDSINSSVADEIPVSIIPVIDSGVSSEETNETIIKEDNNTDASLELKASSNEINAIGESMNKLPADKEEDQKQGEDIPRINESSEAIKILRLFYALLAEEQYDEAYELLDDKFQLSAFKIIGAAEISKNDIDVYTFTEFLKALGIFKTLRIDRILAEINEVTDNKEKISRIYYYQSFDVENSEKIISPLVVILKKDNGWKITALEDGNPDFVLF